MLLGLSCCSPEQTGLTARGCNKCCDIFSQQSLFGWAWPPNTLFEEAALRDKARSRHPAFGACLLRRWRTQRWVVLHSWASSMHCCTSAYTHWWQSRLAASFSGSNLRCQPPALSRSICRWEQSLLVVSTNHWRPEHSPNVAVVCGCSWYKRPVFATFWSGPWSPQMMEGRWTFLHLKQRKRTTSCWQLNTTCLMDVLLVAATRKADQLISLLEVSRLVTADRQTKLTSCCKKWLSFIPSPLIYQRNQFVLFLHKVSDMFRASTNFQNLILLWTWYAFWHLHHFLRKICMMTKGSNTEVEKTSTFCWSNVGRWGYHGEFFFLAAIKTD